MDELDPLLSPGPAVPVTPIGPDDLGLPAPPDPQRYGLDELRQRALSPVQTPDSGLGRILKVIALGAASALGPGRGTGILQGVQAHGDRERLLRERDQMQAQRLYGAMQSDYEQEQAAYQRAATQKQTVLQQNLTALRSAAGKAKTKAEYDQYVEAFGTGLQRMGYRLGPNWLRAQVPYVAPEMSTEAEKVLSSFFSNPMNKQTLEQHPDKLAEISVEFDRDGDGTPELVTLPELAKIAKRPFGVGPDGKLLVYAKGTTSDVKANADGILASLIEQDKAEGKPQTPQRMIELQKLAITKAKEAADLGPDPTLEAIRQLQLQQAQNAPKQTMPPNVQRRLDAKARGFDGQPAVKNAQMMAEAAQFVTSLNNNTTNPADDIGLLYAFAKAMDPNSVVREGEYATVQRYAQSWADTFKFNAQRIFSNTSFLSPQARANMKATVLQKFKAGQSQYNNLRRSYADQINKITGGTDGESYLTDYGGAFPSDAAEPPPSTGSALEKYRQRRGTP